MRFSVLAAVLVVGASAAALRRESSSGTTSYHTKVQRECSGKDTLCLVDHTPEHARHRATLDTASVMYDSSSSHHNRTVMAYADDTGSDNRGKGVLVAPIGSRFRIVCTEEDFVDFHYKSNGFVVGEGSKQGKAGAHYDGAEYAHNGQTGVGEGDHKVLAFDCAP